MQEGEEARRSNSSGPLTPMLSQLSVRQLEEMRTNDRLFVSVKQDDQSGSEVGKKRRE